MPSPSLETRQLRFGWSSSTPLFAELSLHLPAGWTGVVGPNGSGKSTLLQLLSGGLAPAGGSVVQRPEGLSVRLCPQRSEVRTPDIDALAEAWSGEAARLRSALALDPAQLDRWQRLSPGERKRWQVGAALLEAPGALLLDEPTNHLDAEARELLLGALRRYRGVGVLVSHDRALLDALTERTLRLGEQPPRVRPGAWSAARATWTREAGTRQRERDAAREDEARLARRLDQQRDRQRAATRGARTALRMRDRNDHDARSALSKGKAAAGVARQSRGVGLVRAELERARERREALGRDEAGPSALHLPTAPGAPPVLLALDHATPAADPRLPDAPDVSWARGERVWLAGANGAGKTTLLAALWQAAPRRRADLLLLPQHLGVAEAEALRDSLRALPAPERGRALQLAAALGLSPERLLRGEPLSPGVGRKLAMVGGLARGAWGLVLDEPTNHLDPEAIEQLTEALVAYEGALLLVTHDEALARATTTRRWTLSGGTLSVSSGCSWGSPP